MGSTLRINAARGETGVLWQGRFFDRALRTVKEYQEKVEYVHQNAVKAGRVSRAEDWRWWSVQDYTGSLNAPARAVGIRSIDRVLLPADERTRI